MLRKLLIFGMHSRLPCQMSSRELIRDRIKGLPAEEALEEVLREYDSLRILKVDELAEIIATNDLEPAPAILLLTLWRAKGRPVLFETILDRMEATRGWVENSPTRNSLTSAAKRLRKANLPIEVISVYSLGYRLVYPRGWTPFQKPPSRRNLFARCVGLVRALMPPYAAPCGRVGRTMPQPHHTSTSTELSEG